MKSFTTNAKTKNRFTKLLVITFWLTVWQIMCVIISQEILLVSPVIVLKILLKLIKTANFWESIFFSFSKIFIGFILAIFTGTLLAAFSYKNWIIKELVYPIIIVIKSTPVASFIILALIWINSTNLSIFISFLMAMPIIYTNVFTGIVNTDEKLLEMCRIFKVTPLKRTLYIYIPQVMPYFISACSLAIGLAWKAGIAAEVIGLPDGSIGENLYNAKIFLETDKLFAWTLVIIMISTLFEHALIYLIKNIEIKGGKNGHRN